MYDWLFRNRHTREITIAQAPNPPLIVFVVAWILRFVLPVTGWPDTALGLVASLALIVWATDELVRGVNPFRRLLGGMVLAWQLVALWHLVT